MRLRDRLSRAGSVRAAPLTFRARLSRAVFLVAVAAALVVLVCTVATPVGALVALGAWTPLAYFVNGSDTP